MTPEHELLGIMLMDGKIRETETDEMGEEPILQDNLEVDDKMKRENEAIESDEKSDTQKMTDKEATPTDLRGILFESEL